MNARTGIGTSALMCFAATLAAAGPVSAQVILEGRVLGDSSGLPLANARVVLLNRHYRFVASTITDQAGGFRFERKGYGVYRVEASAIGYKQAVSPPMWMTLESDSTVVEMRLAVNVVLLAPLEVVAVTPIRTSPVLEAMEHRRVHGLAVHISREEIAERQPVNVSDILLEVPGVYAERQGAGASGRQLYMARALPGPGGGACPVQVFVDGLRASRDVYATVDELVQPHDVEAIEVFRGLSAVPAEFLTPEARCGVIAIWTRRAMIPGRN